MCLWREGGAPAVRGGAPAVRRGTARGEAVLEAVLEDQCQGPETAGTGANSVRM